MDIYICREKEIHVRPITGRKNRKLWPYKEPRATCIPPMHTNSRNLEAQIATSHIFNGCWWFWGKIYRKITCRSPHRIHQEILPFGCWLYQWNVLWHQTKLELGSEIMHQPIHAKVCTQNPPWIPTPRSKNTLTCTTKMGTLKLWNKKTMVQRGKYIRYTTIK